MSKTFYPMSVHLNVFFLDVSIVRDCNICEYFGHISRYYFNITMNECNTLSEVGGVILVTVSNFLLSGLIPYCITQKSKYSIMVCPNKELLILHLIQFYFILTRESSSFSELPFQLTFIRIKKCHI